MKNSCPYFSRKSRLIPLGELTHPMILPVFCCSLVETLRERLGAEHCAKVFAECLTPALPDDTGYAACGADWKAIRPADCTLKRQPECEHEFESLLNWCGLNENLPAR